MTNSKFNITALDSRNGKRLLLFAWCRAADQGLAKAKTEAKDFNVGEYLSDYRAEPIIETKYNASAVDKAIRFSRTKIRGREARLIHALLKGRN